MEESFDPGWLSPYPLDPKSNNSGPLRKNMKTKPKKDRNPVTWKDGVCFIGKTPAYLVGAKLSQLYPAPPPLTEKQVNSVLSGCKTWTIGKTCCH
jgi:hypothetical protein